MEKLLLMLRIFNETLSQWVKSSDSITQWKVDIEIYSETGMKTSGPLQYKMR